MSMKSKWPKELIIPYQREFTYGNFITNENYGIGENTDLLGKALSDYRRLSKKDASTLAYDCNTRDVESVHSMKLSLPKSKA